MATVRPRASTTTRSGRSTAGRGFDWGQPFVYLIALVVAAIAVGPVVYVFIGGFRTTADLNANPAGLPDPWVLRELRRRCCRRRASGATSSASVDPRDRRRRVGVVVLGIMAAFVIARYNFRGRQGLYTLFAAGLMFPLTVAALPLTLLLRTLGLHGTYLGVIIPRHRVRAADHDHHPRAVPAGDPR